MKERRSVFFEKDHFPTQLVAVWCTIVPGAVRYTFNKKGLYADMKGQLFWFWFSHDDVEFFKIVILCMHF